MDFNLTETQNDLRALAAGLLAKEAAQRRLDAHDRSGAPYDEELWRAMERAGLLGVCVPEEAGGAGLGAVEMAVVLREVGAHAAPAPALPTLVAQLTLARHGSRIPDGVLTAALKAPRRAITAVNDGGWRLTGRTPTVLYAEQAEAILIPADQGLFLITQPWIAPDTATIPGRPEGLTAIPEPTSTGEPAATLVLDDVPAEYVAGPEAPALLRATATAAIAAQASGVLAGALKLTTEHVRTRRQFGRALAEFQAVTMQVADVYIAARALDVAMWSGAWRLATGLPADEDLGVAAYHVGQAATALHTCQHLHGGLGLDVTYPLHRYFAQAKHLSHLLGGADAQLDLIGALL
ncbi:acyl-CoA dehydrogenase family protein [Nonomuraea sp. NPDC046570]|uniref:acyl-CoA dehydrogenase family protein n=1 Tax=Nonomuraea sp. NPDC046570 TaxID=3155255 RepID=UPI0033F33DE3